MYCELTLFRIISDLLCLVPLITVMIVFQRLEPHKSGYFTTDLSITLPLHSSTVPSYILYIVTVALIILTVLVVELLLHRKHLKERLGRLPKVLCAMYNIFILALFGYLATIAVTDIFKVVVGRLRPNFYASCKPTTVTVTSLNFVTDYSCGSKEEKLIIASRKSFPSGHSSTAMFTAIFLCFYLHFRLRCYRVFVSLQILVSMIYLIIGLYVCYSRIKDNKHHPSDVLAGILLGSFIAIWSMFIYSPYDMQLFNTCHKSRNNSEEGNRDRYQHDDDGIDDFSRRFSSDTDSHGPMESPYAK